MLIELQGIYEDGSTRSASLPTDSAVTIRIPKGASTTLRLRVLRASGVPFHIAASDTFLLTVRSTTQYAPRVLERAGTQATAIGPNVVEFALTPADTRSRDPGEYACDIWRTTALGVRDSLLATSTLVLQAAQGLP